MQTVTIDLIPQDELPVIKVSQYNDNWDIRFIITENGQEVQIHPDDVCTFVIRKPDNNIVTIDANTPLYGNGCVITLTEQACACYGKSWGQLVIISVTGGITRRVGTCNFILDVEMSPEFGGIHSTSEIDNLRTQIDAIIEEDAGPIVEDVAGPIVMEMVPEVIGDNYYTKTEIQTNYYTKAQTDNAINAAAGHFLTGTLTTGNTSITLTDNTDNPIDDDSLIDIYTSIYGVNPISAVVDALTHSITLEFDEQESDIDIKVRVN